MRNNCDSLSLKRRIVSAAHSLKLPLFLAVAAFLFIWGCNKDTPPSTPSSDKPFPIRFEASGEEFLISALDEVQSLADLAQQLGNSSIPTKSHMAIISATTVDTTYIYGEFTPDGHGAVVTERHTYPKGLLLITVHKSYGTSLAKIVTEVKRFTSFHEFLADSAQQSNITELYGLSSDTLVTHVSRNGLIETYTFRLPVVTSITNPVDGSVRVTSRFASAGAVRSEIRDGEGNLIQFRDTFGDSTGALTTYTQFANASWRKVRSFGLADGSVHHDVTSGP